MRSLKIVLGILVLLLVIFVAQLLITTGFFRTIENSFDGEIVKQISIAGAEDITVATADSFAIVSSTKRGVYPPLEEEKGALYYLDLKNENYRTKNLTSNLSMSFAPHGISMLKIDSTYKIMAINHTSEGHSFEVFKLDKENLVFEKTLKDPALISPNDLVMIDEKRFYFTNDHGYTEGFGKFLEEYGGLAASTVMYFDGENYTEVASGIQYANGINYDKKRELLYVSSPRAFSVKVYSRNEDGSLNFIENIPCGTGVDNIEFDKEDNLWIGGHPSLLRFAAYAKGDEETAPSEIIKISYKALGDYTVDKIYVEDGSLMSASSVAAPFGKLIIAGNVMDDEFLILKQAE